MSLFTSSEIYMMCDFPQEMALLRSQVSGQVSVEVNAAPQDNLAEVIAEIREEYEAIVKKNNKALEDWYKQKVRVQPKTIVHRTCRSMTRQ